MVELFDNFVESSQVGFCPAESEDEACSIHSHIRAVRRMRTRIPMRIYAYTYTHIYTHTHTHTDTHTRTAHVSPRGPSRHLRRAAQHVAEEDASRRIRRN